MSKPGEMSEALHDAYANMITIIMADFPLEGWIVDLSLTPLDEESDCMAQIKPTDGRRWASLHVAANLHEETLRDIVWTIAHELYHLCHANLDEYIRRTLNPILGNGTPVWEQFEGGLTMQYEFMVDNMAASYARLNHERFKKYFEKVKDAANGE